MGNPGGEVTRLTQYNRSVRARTLVAAARRVVLQRIRPSVLRRILARVPARVHALPSGRFVTLGVLSEHRRSTMKRRELLWEFK